MSDIKDRLKDKLADASDLATKAKEKLKEAVDDAGEKAAELVDAGRERAAAAAKKTGELVSEAGAKTASVTKAGAGQIAERGKALYSRLRHDEKSELQELGQEQTLADLSEDEQDEYLASLLPVLVPFEPSEVDKLRRVYQILAVMELGKQRRHSYLRKMFLATEPPPDVVAGSLDEATRISLGKDIMGLAETRARQDAASKSMMDYLQSLKLTPEQIDVLSKWTSWENTMLAKIGRGDLSVGKEDMPLEAMKKAGAIGIPLGALYASGSVVGFSAAGITSGLATLGGASGLAALGLNPMTAGIAAIVLMGIGIKKLLDAGLPTSQGEKQQKIEGALRAMRARRNRYIAMLTQDLIAVQRLQVSAEDTGESERWASGATTLADLLEAEARMTLAEKTA